MADLYVAKYEGFNFPSDTCESPTMIACTVSDASSPFCDPFKIIAFTFASPSLSRVPSLSGRSQPTINHYLLVTVG